MFFATSYSLLDIKEQFRLRKGLESESQVLDSAI